MLQNMVKLISFSLFLILLSYYFTPITYAATTKAPAQYTAVISSIQEVTNPHSDPSSMWANQPAHQYNLTVTSGNLSGQNITILQTIPPNPNLPNYKKGDFVIITAAEDPNNPNSYYISDFQRTTPIFYLSAFFAFLTIIIGRKRGFTSLIAMVVSFLILFYFTIPQIMNHQDPVVVTILTSFILVPVTFYLSHGFNFKTTSAIVSTFIALIITGILAVFMVDAGKLTGYTTDEASFLQLQTQGTINIRGLLLAGVIISTLGILNDITISQAAIVSQLKKTSPHLKFWDLFHHAMDVGHDHIASAVNTLVLVYTGASLPLLLLFVVNSANPIIALNYEVVAQEVIHTLIASTGLVLAVPITTLFSAYFEGKS